MNTMCANCYNLYYPPHFAGQTCPDCQQGKLISIDCVDFSIDAIETEKE